MAAEALTAGQSRSASTAPMRAFLKAVQGCEGIVPFGRVKAVTATAIQCVGPTLEVGQLCCIGNRLGDELRCEVVGIDGATRTLMPLDAIAGIRAGDRVVALPADQGASIAVGPGLLGHVIDAFGKPLDGRGPVQTDAWQRIAAAPPPAMDRTRISSVLETGVRVIDALLPLGRGQRIGIFAGSGVGKSTLLGMLAQHVSADVNVIALIGERGREVKEFLDSSLGEQGLARSVVVVATSDQPAVTRVRAARAATAIAEYFRDRGLQVLLTMDSLTRFAMAKREIGLVAGEPPTSRGYTPSVFAEIPKLCERAGTAAGGGSITALYTVLVEGDDFNEPVCDTARATLDGHFVLSRELAHERHYPALDVLRSSSRLAAQLMDGEAKRLAHAAMEVLATLDRNRTLVELGAYKEGGNAVLDRAIRLKPALDRFLRQTGTERAGRAQSIQQLRQLVATP